MDFQFYIKEKNIQISSPEVKEVLIMMAMGKPGTLENFADQLAKDDQRQHDIQKLIKILPQKGGIVEKYTILGKFKEQGILEQFLDGWIAYCTHHHIGHANNRLKVKRLFQGNLSKENVVLY